MKSTRARFLGIAVLLLLLASGEVRAQTIRWDIISVTSLNPITILPGGQASALAHDGSKITFTGGGTFDLADPDNVTGGGEWMLLDPKSNAVGKGTYQVTSLVRFTEAPAVNVPQNSVDKIGRPADARSGLAFLRIAYSDGSRGLLAIMCADDKTPTPSTEEGVTATKGFVNFWNRVEHPADFSANATLFHHMP